MAPSDEDELADMIQTGLDYQGLHLYVILGVKELEQR